jgi:hypothetical protein
MMADSQHDFNELMASLSDARLLSVVANGFEYQAAAIEAALKEIRKRGISGFDLEEARDMHDAQVKLRNLNVFVGLSWWMRILLFVLPAYFISPWGVRKYYHWRKAGFELKCEQMAAWSLAGFVFYLLLFSFAPSLSNLQELFNLAWHWLFVMKG